MALRREVPDSLARLLEPRPGGLVLVHAAAGYGKTTALASTQRESWLWYSLDGGDGGAPTLAQRLCTALDITPPPDLPTTAQAAAREVASRLEGRGLTITFDRFEHLGDAGEVGRFLIELLELVPDLALRVATRTRPALALERLRLEGRLVDVGPAELRLERTEIAGLLAQTLGRIPRRTELDFADRVLGGWPAALRLWRPALDGDDVAALVRPLHPLHDYLHEEVFTDTLARETMDLVRASAAWLLEPGPLLSRGAASAEREVAERLVRDRVGVIPEEGGWRLHPLVSAFLRMSVRTHQPFERTIGGPQRPSGAQAGDAARVVVRALGSLAVTVDGVPVDDAAWPTAARRLLELLLSLPGSQATAQEAAGQLWPRHLLRSALNSFNVALHGLRRVLQPDMMAGGESRCVVRQGRLYRLALDEIACDADDFSQLVTRTSLPLDDEAAQRLETAVAMYHGDFLATSSEGFAEQRRDRLRRLRLEALERLGEWHGHAARDEQALHAFNRVLEQSPQREDIWARVLELHLSVGDEYGALAALQRCEQSLAAAAIEPSGLLRELRRRIRREAPTPLDPTDR